MQITACLAIAKHLRDATHGVNQKLGVPLWTGGVDTHTAPPALAVITSPFCDGEAADRCARFEAPTTFPALYVMPDGPFDVQGEVRTWHRSAFEVSVAIRYLVENARSEARLSTRDAAYTMEAIASSLLAFFADDAYGRGARSVRSQHIQMCTRTTYGPWREAVGAARAIAVFALSMEIRNEQP